MLYDGLTVLQHRGQDAAGMVTSSTKHASVQNNLRLRKDNGSVKDVFAQHHMMELKGNVGLGHVRYPTAGSSSCAEAQPLYTNYPFGISVVHNGNLTNTDELRQVIIEDCMRHVNTDSDSELLLNCFAEELCKRKTLSNYHNTNKRGEGFERDVFEAISGVFRQCEGGYAGLYLINGIGLVGFRDPNGIRPCVFGSRKSQGEHSALNGRSERFPPAPPSVNGVNGSPAMPNTPRKMVSSQKLDYCFASESVAIDTLGFTLIRDVKPGEAIFIDMSGNVHNKICAGEFASELGDF